MVFSGAEAAVCREHKIRAFLGYAQGQLVCDAPAGLWRNVIWRVVRIHKVAGTLERDVLAFPIVRNGGGDLDESGTFQNGAGVFSGVTVNEGFTH